MFLGFKYQISHTNMAFSIYIMLKVLKQKIPSSNKLRAFCVKKLKQGDNIEQIQKKLKQNEEDYF